mgnify:FL=1
MQVNQLAARKRITKAIIELQDEQPFWSRLILNMDIQEDVNNELPKYAGMGVDANARMLFKKSFIDELSMPECKGVLAHEIAHVAFGHLIRLGSREAFRFNVAADLVVNTLLRTNGFTLPKDVLMPDYQNKYTFKNKVIEDIDKKAVERVYDELPQETKDKRQGGFDHHGYGEKMTQHEMEEAQQKWNEEIINAAAYAKIRGKEPQGLGKYFKDILDQHQNYRQILYRYVSNTIMTDYTFARPNRKYQSLGIYMPSPVRENISIVLHIDTSGSIGKDETEAYLSETIGMMKSFANIEITLITCDAKIQDVITLTNENGFDIGDLKLSGGGGTSHEPILSWIAENKPDCKILISLTDGFSDIERLQEPQYPVIFVISKNGVKTDFHFGTNLYLED